MAAHFFQHKKTILATAATRQFSRGAAMSKMPLNLETSFSFFRFTTPMMMAAETGTVVEGLHTASGGKKNRAQTTPGRTERCEIFPRKSGGKKSHEICQNHGSIFFGLLPERGLLNVGRFPLLAVVQQQRTRVRRGSEERFPPT